MKIGIFDSGLGGLFITRSITKELPRYDYVYLGDTKRVPYGNRSPQAVHRFLEEAAQYLFERGCKLIVVACNTASAQALRKIQRTFLPSRFPDRRILGVIVPTIEEALAGRHGKTIGILATRGTVQSHAYRRELKKADRTLRIVEQAAPRLAPMIENGGIPNIENPLRRYLKPLMAQRVDSVILGCTHYPIIKKQVRSIVGKRIAVISQEEIIPKKLKDYLRRHREVETQLARNNAREFLVTRRNRHFDVLAKKWFGSGIKLKTVDLTSAP